VEREQEMTDEKLAMPPVASREDWLKQRIALLQEEKAHTIRYDEINAKRRRLPMVRVDKDYAFKGRDGVFDLPGLFNGQRQLVVYHFMFDPQWEKGCLGCSSLVKELGDLSLLEERNTRFVLISRAPLEKLEMFRTEMGWEHPWYSSFDSDFNYDFHATYDEEKVPILANYRDRAELERLGRSIPKPGETHGMSVFFRSDDTVFHTNSIFARGVESLTDTYAMLDITPWGRQESFEDSPPGWPQKPTYE
jgi:predicted dithiol-disulfide oxidoreductase (DUF899 family)